MITFSRKIRSFGLRVSNLLREAVNPWMHVEVLHLANGGGHELRVFDDDTGTEHTEYFVDYDDLLERQHTVIQQIIASAWSQTGGWLL